MFNGPSFFIIKKSEGPSAAFLSSFKFSEKINRFHPHRKNEFILGRFCAYECYKELTGLELLELESSEDRSPLWPSGIVGSITHSKDFVCAALATKENLQSIGIDLEEVGRVKKELVKQICTPKDLVAFAGLTEDELLTLIFSAKESLYKALHPLVKKFFGFDAAYISGINLKDQSFEIVLVEELSLNFGPFSQSRFHGNFKFLNNLCLTVVEII